MHGTYLIVRRHQKAFGAVGGQIRANALEHCKANNTLLGIAKLKKLLVVSLALLSKTKRAYCAEILNLCTILARKLVVVTCAFRQTGVLGEALLRCAIRALTASAMGWWDGGITTCVQVRIVLALSGIENIVRRGRRFFPFACLHPFLSPP